MIVASSLVLATKTNIMIHKNLLIYDHKLEIGRDFLNKFINMPSMIPEKTNDAVKHKETFILNFFSTPVAVANHGFRTDISYRLHYETRKLS